MRKQLIKIVFGGMILLGVMPRSFAATLRQGQDKTQKREDRALLEKALDYFASQKYHECLLILQDLDKKYQLNPRHLAYLGVCYYYDWDYKNATKYLSEVLPQLVNFSPHERSFYYWANAESLFNLQEYQKAIPYYEAMLPLCYDNEKPDAEYRLGFCYLFTENWTEAWNHLLEAQEQYRRFRNTPEVQSRMVQINHMLGGLRPKIVGEVLTGMLK